METTIKLTGDAQIDAKILAGASSAVADVLLLMIEKGAPAATKHWVTIYLLQLGKKEDEVAKLNPLETPIEKARRLSGNSDFYSPAEMRDRTYDYGD